MRKRIAFAISLLLVTMMLAACGIGTDPRDVDYNGRTYEQLESELEQNLQYVVALDAMLAQAQMDVETLKDEELREALKGNYGITDAQMDAVPQWEAVCEQFGSYTETVEDSFTVDKAGNTLTANTTLVFDRDGSTREVDFQIVYDYFSMKITGITIEPVYGMGEKLQRAGLNTLISMCIVFAVLILISLIIYCFKVFPYLEKRKKEKALQAGKAAEPAAAPQPEAAIPRAAEPKSVQDGQGEELVAVIAAAIAAYTGSSTSDFVVRSIHRR